jgi:hypothetical protein
MAFYNVEPFGVQAELLGHAIVACTVANSNRPKNVKPFEVKDFMPDFEAAEPTVNDMIHFAEMMTLGLGGQDLREDPNG